MKPIIALSIWLIFGISSHAVTSFDLDLRTADKTTIDPHELTVTIEKLIELKNKSAYKEADSLIKSFLPIVEKYNDTFAKTRFYYLCALNAHERNNLNEARDLYIFALSYSRFFQFRDLEADILNGLGNIYWRRGNYEMSSKYFKQALSIREEIGPPNKTASILNNMGNQFLNQHNYHDAVKAYESAIAHLELNDEGERLKGKLSSNLAEAFVGLNRFDEALTLLEESLQIEYKWGTPKDIGWTYYNFGELYLKLNNSLLAKEYLLKALAIQNDIDNSFAKALTLTKLAEVEMGLKHYDESKALFTDALAIFVKMEGNDYIRKVSASLAVLHDRMNEPYWSIFYNRLQAGYTPPHPKPIVRDIPRHEEQTVNHFTKSIKEQARKNKMYQRILIAILSVALALLILENFLLKKGDNLELKI